ncbi:MAG: EAL domain-containing protein [Pseudomonadota bacterium]
MVTKPLGRIIALACATAAAAIGGTTLLGRALHHDGLLRLFLNGPPLLPDTALGLLVAAASLAGLAGGAQREQRPRWAALAALLVLALGLMQAADGALGLLSPYSSERLRLIPEPMELPAPPQSAMGLTLAGLALLLGGLRARAARAVAEWLGILLFAGALLGTAGHFYGAFGLSLLHGFGAIPLGAVLGFLVLGLGIPFAVGARAGLAALITSRSGGGTLLRTIAPQALALFLLAGWLQLVAFSRGWVDYRYGAALFAGVGFVVLFFLMWHVALRINRLEAEKRRVNRALRLISHITQAARRFHDEEAFIVHACQTIVDAGYIAAWIGRAGPPPERRVLPVSGAGPDNLREMLHTIKVTWDDSPFGRGAGGTCIRTGAACVIRDTLNDPGFAPWRSWAQDVGFRSVGAFPLRVDGRVEGALLIYAAIDSFGDAECELLEDLAEDMGYAIGALRAAVSRNEAEAALRRSEASLARAQNIAHVGSWEWDVAANHMQWSEQTYQLFGCEFQELEASLENFMGFAHAEDRHTLEHTLAQVQRGEVSAARCQFRAVWDDGTVRHLDLQAEVEFADTGPCRVVGVLQDISERVRFEEELARLARYDALTGLPNRHLLQDRLEQAMTHARRGNRMLAVAFVDLDRFKIVNDSLGHDAGDQLLKEVARRLVSCLRPGDTVARQGGDEFVVVLTDLAKAEDAAFVAQKMLDTLAPPVPLNGQEVLPSASIGIALFPRDGATLQELMMNADKAMYSAKHAGRSQYRFYDVEMNRAAGDWLEITGSLHRALERNEFRLYYQPKLAIKGGTTGVEALLRWVSQEHGVVAPAKFIPVLEETGRIVEVGEWVIREACRQARRWREQLGVELRVAVNLSLRQFQQADLVERVTRILTEEGMPPGSLELEITESTVAQNVERAIAIMHAFKRLGLWLTIDDFGTGYSSLAALKRFPVDCLKIDRSFVQDLPDDTDSATIARAIVALAHSMGLAVVAEGVETAAQYRFLIDCGCDEIQGYLFARPMPAEELAQMLAAPQPARLTLAG